MSSPNTGRSGWLRSEARKSPSYLPALIGEAGWVRDRDSGLAACRGPTLELVNRGPMAPRPRASALRRRARPQPSPESPPGSDVGSGGAPERHGPSRTRRSRRPERAESQVHIETVTVLREEPRIRRTRFLPRRWRPFGRRGRGGARSGRAMVPWGRANPRSGLTRCLSDLMGRGRRIGRGPGHRPPAQAARTPVLGTGLARGFTLVEWARPDAGSRLGEVPPAAGGTRARFGSAAHPGRPLALDPLKKLHEESSKEAIHSRRRREGPRRSSRRMSWSAGRKVSSSRRSGKGASESVARSTSQGQDSPQPQTAKRPTRRVT